MPLLGVALVAVLALAVSSTGSAKTAAPAKAQAPIKVALITDIGGLNDRSFNMLANRGLQDAIKKLGVTGRVYISKSNADYVPNLSSAARGKYDLVVAVGFLMADAVAAVAKSFPDTNFAIIDYPSAGLKGKPKNVRGLMFASEQAGCLAGTAAATMSKTGTIGSVGGLKIPSVDDWISGYRYCAKKVNPSIKTLNDYSQDFVDQAKCKEKALNEIAAGADVLFQVAGQCGLGVLSAAKEKGVWGIGVDADQGYIGSHVLTSGLKKVNVSVYSTAQMVMEGKFKGGTDSLFNIQNGGVGYGKISAKAPASLKALLDTTVASIKAGKLGKIPRTFK
jgi:basic membrane protein A